MRHLAVLLFAFATAVLGLQVPLAHARAHCVRPRSHIILADEPPQEEVFKDMDGNIVQPPDTNPPPPVDGKPQTDMPIPEFGLPVPGWLITFGGAALLGAMPSLIKTITGE